MNELVLKVNVRSEFVFGDDMLEITVNFGAGCVEGRPVGLRTKELRFILTAVVKKVVGTHYFLAIFGPLGAHFNPQPLRQPHGMTVSHIVKVNHTVVERSSNIVKPQNAER